LVAFPRYRRTRFSKRALTSAKFRGLPLRFTSNTQPLRVWFFFSNIRKSDSVRAAGFKRKQSSLYFIVRSATSAFLVTSRARNETLLNGKYTLSAMNNVTIRYKVTASRRYSYTALWH
jgi:hypothetical protein